VLHGLGQVVVLVDFRGSGGSGGDRTSVGYDEARDVAAAMRWARVDLRLDRPVLYGTSMGAAAVLRAVAVEGVQPRALVLEAPFDRLLTTVRHRFEAMRLPSFPGAELLLFWASVQSGFNAFQHNPVDYARRVHVPTLILHGHDDPRVTEAEARAIYDRLPAAKVIEVFPNVGHGVTGVIPPETWRDVVGRFLSALSPN
jgi:dipeptidyl aminopeptidase/acylaminoacyl peptidase